MGLILVVVWVVLMVLWLVFDGSTWDRASPRTIGSSLIPWACVLIIGIVLFGGYYPVNLNR